MARLNLKAIEERIKPLAGKDEYDREFIFDLMLAYGRSKGNITRLRNGSLNIAEDPEHEVAQKNVIYFRETTGDLLQELERLRVSPVVIKFATRFVIVTDYTEMIAYDLKTAENRTFPLREIDQHFTFFLPWAGMEKAQYTAESHADVKAAEKMGKLFDELASANPAIMKDPEQSHGLNVFFTRLLFCYFAEDTGIFGENQFTNAVGSHTLEDGSDTADFIRELFAALDEADPKKKPGHLADFPYVNGRLFRADAHLTVPRFSPKARKMLIELGRQIWLDINPDIFGSMFQAVVDPKKRSNLGQHYTSVPNILKTIDPLFMDELKEEFDKAYDSPKKLVKLLDRIARIKVFDPACGSGNFLLLAYRELRRIETDVIVAIRQRRGETGMSLNIEWEQKLSIGQFYGFELNWWPAKIAETAMFLVDHQANKELANAVGRPPERLPIKITAHIVHGNALQLDWETILPPTASTTFVFGNPPFIGARMMSKQQKAELKAAWANTKGVNQLDYVTGWHAKAKNLLASRPGEFAFVTTNSIAQGQPVPVLFGALLREDWRIKFAHRTFAWDSEAPGKAAVHCVIVGFTHDRGVKQRLWDYPDIKGSSDEISVEQGINAYLVDGANVLVESRKAVLSPSLVPAV